MAELIIKIGNSPGPAGFRDGDLVQAHNDEDLLWQHTQRIVSLRGIGEFLKPVDSMAFRCAEAVREYKFERISQTEVTRTEIASGDTDAFIGDVPLFIARRLESGSLPIYGELPTVVWFGGNTEASLAKLTQLWADVITPETGLLQADHLQQTHSSRVLKRYLVIVTDDFSNARRNVMESPEMTLPPLPPPAEEPEFVSKRNHFVVWQSLSGLSGPDKIAIADPQVIFPVDRGTVRVEASIVVRKGPPN